MLPWGTWKEGDIDRERKCSRARQKRKGFLVQSGRSWSLFVVFSGLLADLVWEEDFRDFINRLRMSIVYEAASM